MHIAFSKSHVYAALGNGEILSWDADLSFSSRTVIAFQLMYQLDNVNFLGVGQESLIVANSCRVIGIETKSLNVHELVVQVGISTVSCNDQGILFIGTDMGKLSVYRVSSEAEKLSIFMLGTTTLLFPILSLSWSSLAVAVCGNEKICLLSTAMLKILCEFKTSIQDSRSSVIINNQSLVWRTGSTIKFYKPKPFKQKKVKQVVSKRVKYSKDRHLEMEVDRVLQETQSEHQARVDALNNSVKFNGEHGMSYAELEEYVMLLSMQEHDPAIPTETSHMTESEMVQIAIDASRLTD